jgi:hypothetical protein
MKLSTFLLSLNYDTNVFNGHIQTELKCISEDDFMNLLEEIYHDEKNEKRVLYLSLYEEGSEKDKYISLTLYQKDYWKKSENQNFLDRMIISFEKINYYGNYKDFLSCFLKKLEEKKYIEYKIENV